MNSLLSILNEDYETDAYLIKATIDVFSQIVSQNTSIISQLELYFELVCKIVESLMKFKMLQFNNLTDVYECLQQNNPQLKHFELFCFYSLNKKLHFLNYMI